MAAVDLNGDGYVLNNLRSKYHTTKQCHLYNFHCVISYDDLVVGAPMYSNVTIDTGRIVVLQNINVCKY